MWGLTEIIRINNEAQRAFEAKNPTAADLKAPSERNEGIWDPEKGIFGKVTYVRSMYEGCINGCSPQSEEGEELP